MLRFVVILFTCIVTGTAHAAQPNVLVILMDDLGWADVSYHDTPEVNAGVKTPAIDALVAGGLELRQFYASPEGFQTRAALITGRFPLRYGFQGIAAKSRDESGLPRAETALPKLLKDRGYQTHLVGSWGLGSDEHYRPLDRGFDHHYGPVGEAIEQYGHCTPSGKLDWYRDGKMSYDEGYTADLLATEAMRVFEQDAAKGPVYVQLGFTTPHKPYQAPQSFLQQYLDDPVPERRGYQASIAATDAAIARVIQKLDELGLAQNTIVFFLSDNGGDSKNGRAKNLPLRGSSGSDSTEKLYDGSARVPAVMRWSGTVTPGVLETPTHPVDIFATVLTAAGARPSDTVDGVNLRTISSAERTIPIQLTKKTVVLRRGNWKLIARVESSSKSSSGSTSTTAATSTSSAASTLMMGRALTDDAATWVPTKAELYNLSKDPYEKTDLSNTNPEVVQRMLQEVRALLAVAAAPYVPTSNSGQGSGPPGTTNDSTGSN